MTKMIFVNLPVTDLAAATRFYDAIGCQKNEQFSNDQASSMVWSDAIYFHLLTQNFFKTFTDLPLADARSVCGALYALSFDDRAEVDRTAEAARGAGGAVDLRPATDMEWMYSRQIADPDGNILELVWMNVGAMAAG